MINKIFVSGGSQCIGGGFINDDVKKAYNEKFNIKIDNNLDFAYPNILAKKLGVDIVNEGAPGGSITRMIRKTYEYIFKNKKFKKLALGNIPMGKLATESDIATTVCFLASSASSMITGTSIVIDGGWTAQ